MYPMPLTWQANLPGRPFIIDQHINISSMKSKSFKIRNHHGSEGVRALPMIPSANVVKSRRRRGIKRSERKKGDGK